MALPESLVEMNRLVFNPLYRTFSWAIPPYAVVIVRDEEPRVVYPVPVQAYGGPDNSIIIGMTYGSDRKWVRNIFSAGGAQIWQKGRSTLYVNPRYVPAAEGYRHLPRDHHIHVQAIRHEGMPSSG